MQGSCSRLQMKAIAIVTPRDFCASACLITGSEEVFFSKMRRGSHLETCPLSGLSFYCIFSSKTESKKENEQKGDRNLEKRREGEIARVQGELRLNTSKRK